MEYTCNCSPNQSQPSGAANSFGYNSMPLVGTSDMPSSCGGKSPEAACSSEKAACNLCCMSTCQKTCTNGGEPYSYDTCALNCPGLCASHQGPESETGMSGQDAITQCFNDNKYSRGPRCVSTIQTCALPKCGPATDKSSGECRSDVQTISSHYCAGKSIPNGPAPNGPGSTPNGPGSTPNGPGSTPNGPGSTPNGPGSTPNGPGSTPPAPVPTPPGKTPGRYDSSGTPFIKTTKGKATVGVGVVLGIAVIVGAVYFITKPKGRK
jgi:hypothetical protein